MSKMRVWELARDLGIEPSSVEERACELGIEVRDGHLAILDAEAVERLRLSLRTSPVMSTSKRVGSTVVRRRRTIEPAASAAPISRHLAGTETRGTGGQASPPVLGSFVRARCIGVTSKGGAILESKSGHLGVVPEPELLPFDAFGKGDELSVVVKGADTLDATDMSLFYDTDTAAPGPASRRVWVGTRRAGELVRFLAQELAPSTAAAEGIRMVARDPGVVSLLSVTEPDEGRSIDWAPISLAIARALPGEKALFVRHASDVRHLVRSALLPHNVLRCEPIRRKGHRARIIRLVVAQDELPSIYSVFGLSLAAVQKLTGCDIELVLNQAEFEA